MKKKINSIIKMIIKQLLKVFYIFPLKSKNIYILSFQGKADYGYDARAIVEYSNNNNLGYKFVWGYRGNINGNHENVKYVKTTSIVGLYYALTSKIFITNINPFSFLPYRKNQIIINTWHGFGPKKGGKFALNSYDKEQYNLSDCFLSANDYYKDIVIKESFGFEGKIIDTGFCRNDVLYDKDRMEKRRWQIRKKYSIENKGIVLYAPTFRNGYESYNASIDFEVLIKELERKYNKEWGVFLRAHPNTIDSFNTIQENIIDVSNEEDMHDLICASDILISDYSSVMWDFAQTRRPIIMYVDDIDNYTKNDRALYSFFYDLPYYMAKNNNELIEVINRIDKEDYLQRLENFFKKCNSHENGTACKQLFEYIENSIRRK